MTRKNFKKQQKLEAAKQKSIDPPAPSQAIGESTGVQLHQTQQPAGTVVVQVESDQQNGSQHVSRTGSHDNLIYPYNYNDTQQQQQQQKINNAFLSPSTEQHPQHPATVDTLDVVEPVSQIVIQPYTPYVWSAAVPGYFHPHHWQLFYILAFFTRFEHWVSRVGGGIALACYMQGIMGKYKFAVVNGGGLGM